MKVLYSLTIVGMLWMMGPSSECKAQPTAKDLFTKMKTLQGVWKSTNGGEHQASVTYETRSNGSVLLETLKPEGESTMITVYHLDGDRLMLTHYCSSGNQPRMLADPVQEGDQTIQFKFMDATNLANTNEGHMTGLAFTIADADHLRQRWIWTKDGTEQANEFKLERVKVKQ